MKIKDGFWVREVGGTFVAVPLSGDARALSCIVNLNESGALLFQALQNGAEREELADELLKKYDATRDEALGAVDNYVATLEDACLLTR